jgi:hypothetical protein
MRAKTSKTFRRERKLAKEVQSSETAKLTGMREHVAAFLNFTITQAFSSEVRTVSRKVELVCGERR